MSAPDRRPPVLALHGLGADHRQPLQLLPIEVPAALVLAPDLRAHGLSTLDEDPGLLNIPTLCTDVIGLLEQTPQRRPYLLVGVSLGAAVALCVAVERPELVAGLVLIRPAWLHQPAPTHLQPLIRIGELLLRHGATAGRRRFEQDPTYATAFAQQPEAAAAALGQFDAVDATRRAQRLLQYPRSVPYRHPADLAAVTGPVTVIGCPDDPLHPLDLAEELAARLGTAVALTPGRYTRPAGHRAVVHELVLTAWRTATRFP